MLVLDHIKGTHLYRLPVKLIIPKDCSNCGVLHTETEGISIYDPRMTILFFNCRCGGTLAVRHFHTDEVPEISVRPY